MISRDKLGRIQQLAVAAYREHRDFYRDEVTSSCGIAGLYRVSDLAAWDQKPRPAIAALRQAVAELPAPELLDLAALAWLGRGDFDDFTEAREYAAMMRPSAEYVCEKPLHRYLRAASSA